MNHRRWLATALALVFVLVALSGKQAAAAAPAKGTFVVDEAYARYVEETLVGMGTWPGYGFRAAGSSADNAAAAFVASQMKRIGLTDVRLEGVPVDAWEFRGAKLTVSQGGTAQTFVAASMGGSVGTPKGGLSGEIVYVGRGTPGEYPAGGVQGKLLLVDWDADWFWVNLIGNQATLAGAKGIIISTMNHPAYYASPDSLGSFDATYNDEWVPLITISRNSGFAIMDLLAKGAVQGTMASDVTMTLAEDGGMGYNAVGVLRGADHEHPILVVGHHDAWFYGASDDTSAVAGMLAWAKAMVKAGYRPAHDIIFVSDTGEEYGYTDAYYEWLIGAWYMITQAHPDWARRAIAFVNLEGLGGQALDGSRGPFAATTNYELAPFVRNVFKANPELLPMGWVVDTTLGSWTDGYTMTAAGIPGVTVGTEIAGYDAVYHTNEDDLRFVNYATMDQEVQLLQKLLAAMDHAAVLPYAFSERALSIAQSVDNADVTAVGVDVTALDRATSQFRGLARKYDALAPSLTSAQADAANALLMRASYLTNSAWSGLDCWDAIVYPTQQVQWDAAWLAKAMGFLKAGNVKSAVNQLWNVCLTWNAFFDYPVWKAENDRHAPGAPHLDWGAQGHLAPYVDIYAPFVSLWGKSATGGAVESWEIDAISAVLASEVAVLQDRVDAEVSQVLQVNAYLGQLIGMAA